MAGIMIQGTTSSAGKSLLSTGLCRIFKEDGYKVYPFKSQNMSSEYYKTKYNKKISKAQALQAIASGLEPNEKMNPILLKPLTDEGSKVILMGEEKYEMKAVEYFKFKSDLKPKIKELYDDIEDKVDIVVIEGAGSPAEINLKENDIVNMGMAEMAGAPVILIADIDRGGVFASLYGTVKLLDEDEQKRVKGLVINKFRGDKVLLDPGIKMIEEILNIPVIGTLPFVDIDLDINNKNIEKNIDELSYMLRDNLDLNMIYSLVGIKNE